MAKAKTTKKQKSREETLWEAANKLRGTVESSEYKHIVLFIKPRSCFAYSFLFISFSNKEK